MYSRTLQAAGYVAI